MEPERPKTRTHDAMPIDRAQARTETETASSFAMPGIDPRPACVFRSSTAPVDRCFFAMSFFRTLESHRDLVLDALRVYLGAGLFFRGLALVTTEGGLQLLLGTTEPGLGLTGLTVYVTAAHVVGGALLTVGLYTRLAALVQLPILVGAVFLVHWNEGLLSADQSLEFSALVLFLLVLVGAFGGGRWSMDAKWRRLPAPVVSDASRRPAAQN